MRFPFTNAVRKSVYDRLKTHEVSSNNDTDLIRAAVTIVLKKSETENETCFLLTRRAKTLSKHSGQYALPGGRLEIGESAHVAALRELQEEVGLKARKEHIIGKLDDFASRSGFLITPFVVWLDSDAPTSIDPSEVNEIFSIPIKELANPDIPKIQNIAESSRPVLSLYLESLEHEIFAPTAAILYQFREISLFGRSTRVSHYEQPIFAWR
ncbi:MAG: coenzyme A pyrophosphatase [Acidiferrobacteraceae bacterium]|nr:coenzyme A pyrophosphatase [Acidiferrobacteraceae bacterium]|tara:strand:+ start:1603 stop:2235 length:633 start_codon:yes stop_codon:yes gene_type:complete